MILLFNNDFKGKIIAEKANSLLFEYACAASGGAFFNVINVNLNGAALNSVMTKIVFKPKVELLDLVVEFTPVPLSALEQMEQEETEILRLHDAEEEKAAKERLHTGADHALARITW